MMRLSRVLVPMMRGGKVPVWRRAGLGDPARAVLWPLGHRALERLAARLDQVLEREGSAAVTASGDLADALRVELRSYRDLPRVAHRWIDRTRVEVARLDGQGEDARAACVALERALVAELAALGVAARGLDVGAGAGASPRAVAVRGGPDEILACPSCGFAALRAATPRRAPPVPRRRRDSAEPAEPERVATPGATTVAEVSRQLDVPASRILKTMVCAVDGRTFVAVLPGDRTLHLGKLAASVGGREARLAEPDAVRRLTGADVGWAGPVGLRAVLVVDASVSLGTAYATGANAPEVHLRGVVPGHHFDPDVTADIAWAEGGDACPQCAGHGASQAAAQGSGEIAAGVLAVERGTLVARITGPTPDTPERLIDGPGGPSRPWLSRVELDALALLFELVPDGERVAWPPGLAPADVFVAALDAAAGEAAATALEAAGRVVVLDDRDERAGTKFHAAEVLGIATVVVAGKRAATDGFEVRVGGEVRLVTLAELPGAVAPVG